MLDAKSKEVLKVIVSECEEGGYKIIDIDDFLNSLPNHFYFDKDLILQAVKYLENGDYISVKYADDEKFCLCPLPFGRQFMENEANHAKNKKEIKKIGSKIYFFAMFCALIGSFLGTLLYDIVFKNIF